MTVMELVRYFEDYYGKYKPVVKAELITYLSAQSDAFLIGVKQQVISDVSYVYGKPPDVALLDKYHRLQETFDIGHRIIDQLLLKNDVEKSSQQETHELTGGST
jgi:hypothetical protein